MDETRSLDDPTNSSAIPPIGIAELHHFAELKKHLEKLTAAQQPIPWNIKELMTLIMEWIKNDSAINHFQDCLDCLHSLSQFENVPTNPYKTHDNDFARILDAYYKNLRLLSKEGTPAFLENVSGFFNTFKNSTKVQAYEKATEGTFNPFSAQFGIQSAIAAINKIYASFIKLNERTHSERSQRAYSQLLDDILEGEQTVQALLPLMHEQHASENEGLRTLLPQSEFDVPSGEPEHPKFIGFNETMNFNPEELKAIAELFTTEDLKKTFLEAFPWSVDLENIDYLEDAQAIPSMNLLGISLALSPKLQLAIIKYALLSLDTISKLAGFEGQLTIHNFDSIKEISDKLQNVSDLLTKLTAQNTLGLSKQLHSLTVNLKTQNKAYYRLRKDPGANIQIQSNPNMNGFCHINEVLVHILTGVKLLNSVLTPKHPPTRVAEKMNVALMPKNSVDLPPDHPKKHPAKKRGPKQSSGG